MILSCKYGHFRISSELIGNLLQKMYIRYITLSIAFLACQFLTSCNNTDVLPREDIQIKKTEYLTKNVVLVVIDGPRFTETWGDINKKYIPKFTEHLAPKGIVYNNFINGGTTNTNSGHAAITTGFYQDVNNTGEEYPTYPSIFQVYLNQTKNSPDKAFVITGKSKLNVLIDCTDPHWRGKFNPSFDTEDRSDLETFERAIEIFNVHQPNLALVHFKGPDKYGHQGNWDKYIHSIQETDSLFLKLWEFLQKDAKYKDSTTLIMTNDHGRHSDHVATGFKGHGDGCEGCRHINFFAIGPDFKQGFVHNQKRGQVDISPTIAELMGFTMPKATGNVMIELFQ